VSAPIETWVVSVLLADDLLALNRATGIIRRRNLPVGSLSLGPSGRPGTVRLSFVVSTDRAATDRLANALRKMVEVREVTVHSESQCTTREHALVRVRVSPAQLSPLLDVVSLYEATIVEESPQDLLLEATGTAPFMVSLLRALEPFGILDLARGGALFVARQPAGDTPGAARTPTTAPRIAAAIPA
jgi:acetolactate synthase-1/3 small subunit